MGARRKEEAIKEWNLEKPKRDAARLKRGVPEFVPDDDTEYEDIIAKARQELGVPDPAVPAITCLNAIAGGDPTRKSRRKHQDKIMSAGTVTEEFWGMVHTPIDISKAMKIPDAKAAVEKEWHKLGVERRAWDVSTVRPMAEVQAEAIAQGRTVHFGSLRDLCQVKHSEIKGKSVDNGRIIFRGDIVRDESGFYAVFSEQGTSASHTAAAKFMDAIANFPVNEGEDADAVGAYT